MARKRVLWVDDEIEFLRSHIMFLETRGYSVTPVFNGDDAMHMLVEKPNGYDIVLLDEQMPGKDGLATLVEIKEYLPDLPVVMVTKSEEEQLMEDALGRKIDGYLTKPVNPSQILLVCKRLLHSEQIISSQLKQDFVRNYSKNRERLQGIPGAGDWAELYANLTKWDFEVERIGDEGIRQTHAGQKSDANKLFSAYVTANYGAWVKGKDKPPLLSVGVLDEHVIPLLKQGRNVRLVVLDSMRLDQYLLMEPLLRESFDISRHTHYAILPSTTRYTRNSLLSGLFPGEIAERFPDIWRCVENESQECEPGKELLRAKLADADTDMADRFTYIRLTGVSDGREFLANLSECRDTQFVVVVADFVDMLIRSRTTSEILQEIASDEAAFRRLTHSWFERSNIYRILVGFAGQDCTVVLTTSNGSNLCTRGTELYGDNIGNDSLRYRFGDTVSSDERYAWSISDTECFGLPRATPGTKCLILKENYYFVGPDSFQNYNERYRNTFQHGGISMEELIAPIAVMTRRTAGA